MLSNFAKHAIHIPLNKFHAVHSRQHAARRIKQVRVPSTFRTAAQRIAKAIQKEPPVNRQTLARLVTDSAKKQNAELHLWLKSLQDELNGKHNKLDVKTPVRNSKKHKAAAT